MWALAIISGEVLSGCSLWVDAISLLLPSLCQLFTVTDRAAEVTGFCQLHQVQLCVVLEGLWPELDQAGILGPDTAVLCRQAFERQGVRSSKMQVMPGWDWGKGEGRPGGIEKEWAGVP
jgi:hypothetical protein